MLVAVSNFHISIYIFIPISYDASLSTREGDEIERSQKRELNEEKRERETLNLYTCLFASLSLFYLTTFTFTPHDAINTANLIQYFSLVSLLCNV